MKESESNTIYLDRWPELLFSCMIKKREAIQILRHSDQSLKSTHFNTDELEVKIQVKTADLSLETTYDTRYS